MVGIDMSLFSRMPFTGKQNQLMAHPCAKIRHPTGDNGGPLVKADGFLCSHIQAQWVYPYVCMYVL